MNETWIQPVIEKIKMTVREKVSDGWRAVNTIMLGMCTFLLVSFYNKQEARGTKLDEVLIRLAVQEQFTKRFDEDMASGKVEVKEIKNRLDELRLQVNLIEK